MLLAILDITYVGSPLGGKPCKKPRTCFWTVGKRSGMWQSGLYSMFTLEGQCVTLFFLRCAAFIPPVMGNGDSCVTVDFSAE